MALVLEIISEHKELREHDCVREFNEGGGTIGRSRENDWILPDPNRYISGKHATVDYLAGAYYLADTSSNGVYVNDSALPLGKRCRRRLFDGDKIRMGEFEVAVKLNESEGPVMPPDPPVTVAPEHIEQLVPEEALKSSNQLRDEEEITGDKEFQSTLFDGHAEKELTPADLLDALFDGAGISRSEIHPLIDPIEVMRNAGQVLREYTAGTTELLKCRTNLKCIFRIGHATILPQYNNPLKLCESTKDSMKQLLIGPEDEYLGPIDSVKEVCRDLKFHHEAVLEAMNTSSCEFADRFDPDELKENFDGTLKKKPLFNAPNQSRYWQLYCDLYPVMTQRDSGQYPHMFGEEFVREYNKQIAEFKRLDRGADDSQPVPTLKTPPKKTTGRK